METLQKGGTPDLAPLQKAPELSPVVPPPVELPLPEPIEPLPPLPRPVPPLPPAPAPAEPKAAPLQTYASDFSDRMKETHASAATVLAAEQDEGSREQVPEPPSRRNLFLAIAGGVFLIAGAGGAYVAYERYLSASAPVILAPTISAPIFFDESEEVSGTGADLLRSLEESVARPIAEGAVRLLHLEGATTTGNVSVFSALQMPAPNIVLRNIIAGSSMAGIVSVDGEQSPFFILSVASFGDTFAGMLAWETAMPRDLAGLFPPYPVPLPEIVATSTGATSSQAVSAKQTKKPATTTPPAPVFVPAFRDEIIANHDVRAYRDAEGRSVLLYGYWDQSTLVIARDQAAFTEILGRLATSRAQK
mgnify:FL=1